MSTRVINEDIVDFSPSKNYDLIVSISTMEHVGWDEYPNDPPKILKGLRNLTRLLSPRGSLLLQCLSDIINTWMILF